MSDDSSNAEVCQDCGRPLTELIAGGTIRYCWWCEDRAATDQGMVQNCRECGTPLPAGYLCDRCDSVEGWP